MAAVVDAPAATLAAAGSFAGARVSGCDGVPIGTITELMIEGATGRIGYAAIAVGGVFGVGERLFAVAWDAFIIDPIGGAFSLQLTRAEVEATAGFDKDDWPTGPDPALSLR